MKNYELVAELMKLPAGYEISFGKTILKDEFKNGQDTMFVGGTVSDIEIDDTEKIIEFFC